MDVAVALVAEVVTVMVAQVVRMYLKGKLVSLSFYCMF